MNNFSFFPDQCNLSKLYFVFHKFSIQFNMMIAGEKSKLITWNLIRSPEYICFSCSPKGIWSETVIPTARKGYFFKDSDRLPRTYLWGERELQIYSVPKRLFQIVKWASSCLYAFWNSEFFPEILERLKRPK